MTPRELILSTAELFRRAGVPDPENDAALILSHLTGLSHLSLRLDTDTLLEKETLFRYLSLRDRRIDREPLQYILREAPFGGLSFHVDQRVLIPRPETELLCEWALELFPGSCSPKILDLCCGSGCIGILLKRRLSNAEIWATDLSQDALEVAALNASRLGADIHFVRSDLFCDFSGPPYDLIISNPPYIPSPACRSLQPEVMREPLGALDGGDDGLSFYRRICREAPDRLVSGGLLMMELGDGESDSVASMMRNAGFSRVTVRNDYQSMPRMICGMKT